MVRSVSVKNAAQYFYLADLYQLSELNAKVVQVIRTNKQMVIESDSWKEFIRPNMALFEQLFTEMVILSLLATS